MKAIYCFFVFMVLSGCSGAFQPLPPEYELWQKKGAAILDIKKILLECGAATPTGAKGGQSKNDMVLTDICIEKAGFVSLNPFKGKKPESARLSWCLNWPDLPACQPDAEIPTPSVERRLNSRYCRIRTSFQACFENSMIVRTEWCESLEYPYARLGVNWPDRQACLDAEKKIATERCETRNYNKPPAECLP